MEKEVKRWCEIPRIMISAPSSNAGKTVITCGLLRALAKRRLKLHAYKCGPDYIDPLFHEKALGIKSRNLDAFFQTTDQMRHFFAAGAKDLAVIEGAMGYFDGLGGISSKASAFDVANRLDAPVILVIDAAGSGLSVCAQLQGFLSFQPEPAAGRPGNRIAGVILNGISPMFYERIKSQLEARFAVAVLGYLPKLDWLSFESRHLGLVLPDEISTVRQQLDRLGEICESSLDIDGIIALARRAVSGKTLPKPAPSSAPAPQMPEAVTIGIAKDEAFCFYYQDNLELLTRLGARLVYFSPLHQAHLPAEADGLIFGGGYPELYAPALERNVSIRQEILKAAERRMPILGECGGFLYLQQELAAADGKKYKMAGVLPGSAFGRERLQRFGYITLQSEQDGVYLKQGEEIRGHEFHYWDSDYCGEFALARKPSGKQKWQCMCTAGRVMAGFPHLYYPSNETFARRIIDACRQYRRERKGVHKGYGAE